MAPRPVPLLALAVALAACAEPPLGLAVRPIPVGYDRVPLVGASPLDLDNDGDLDLLLATTEDFRYLQYEAQQQGWIDATAGTALAAVAAVEALHPVGEDAILVRGGQLSRLVHSGIGSWKEEPGPVPETAPEPVLTVTVDLDGDGRLDEARLDGRRLFVSWRPPDGPLVDVTRRVGADGLLLPGEGRQLFAGDLEGDGDTDLLAVGDRLLALINNGGRLRPPGDD